MNEMWGYWRYRDETSMLFFNSSLIGNKELGLYLVTSKKYHFKVLNKNGKPLFEIDNGLLEKE